MLKKLILARRCAGFYTPMANEKNLKPVTQRTKSEAREISKKGGVASGKSRRMRKTFRELLEIALALPSANGGSNAEEIVASMIRKAQDGDVKAFEAVRDTIGEKPADVIETHEKAPEGMTEMYAWLAQMKK